MFIRRTNTRNRASGEAYFSHRLVETSREGNAIRQRTLLNLGSRFNLPQAEWPLLVARIKQLLHGQASLLTASLSEATETLAQRYAAQLIARQRETTSETAASAASGGEPITGASRFVEVDLSTLEQVRPRTVGVEVASQKLGATFSLACQRDNALGV